MTRPFLLYHEIEVPGRATCRRDPGYLRYVVRSDALRAQLEALVAHGWTGISVGDALAGVLPAPAAVLTFDDGCGSDVDVVAPLLEAMRFRATFYVVSDWIGRHGYMTARQVRSLADRGFEVASHSVSHTLLTRVPMTQLRRELIDSRARLEAITGRPVIHFACPGGVWDRRIADEARAAGYVTVATSDVGVNCLLRDRFQLRRIPIHRTESVEMFWRCCAGQLTARLAQQRSVRLAKALVGETASASLRDALFRLREGAWIASFLLSSLPLS